MNYSNVLEGGSRLDEVRCWAILFIDWNSEYGSFMILSEEKKRRGPGKKRQAERDDPAEERNSLQNCKMPTSQVQGLSLGSRLHAGPRTVAA
jgi:hypothetical protein